MNDNLNSNEEYCEVISEETNPFNEKGQLKDIVGIKMVPAEEGSFEASKEGQEKQMEMLYKMRDALTDIFYKKGVLLYTMSVNQAKYHIDRGPIHRLPLGQFVLGLSISRENVLRKRLISLLETCRESPRLLTFDDFETVFNDASPFLKENVNFELMNYYGIIFRRNI